MESSKRAKREAQAAAVAAGPHAPFTALLQKYVQNGHVNYAGFKKEEAQLDKYLEYFAKTNPETLPRDEKMAFYINAYNAYTVKLILRKYPNIKSIKDFWGPWDKRDWAINGKKTTLSDIEHQVLRKMGDPRIHVAINCASGSCPDLRSEAFVASRLDAQLDDAMRLFLASKTKGFRAASEPGRLYGTNHNVYLSKIFSWFAQDFGNSEEEILNYIQPWLPEDGKKFLQEHQGNISVSYMDYDWSLNGE